jgi:hypothetical protein
MKFHCCEPHSCTGVTFVRVYLSKWSSINNSWLWERARGSFKALAWVKALFFTLFVEEGFDKENPFVNLIQTLDGPWWKTRKVEQKRGLKKLKHSTKNICIYRNVSQVCLHSWHLNDQSVQQKIWKVTTNSVSS